MKAKVGVLVSKSENDDLLINALTLELAAARQVCPSVCVAYIAWRANLPNVGWMLKIIG